MSESKVFQFQHTYNRLKREKRADDFECKTIPIADANNRNAIRWQTIGKERCDKRERENSKKVETRHIFSLHKIRYSATCSFAFVCVCERERVLFLHPSCLVHVVWLPLSAKERDRIVYPLQNTTDYSFSYFQALFSGVC